MKRAAYRPWTPAEDARVRESFGLVSIAVLSAQLGRTPGGIWQRARKLKARPRGWNLRDAAKACGYSVTQVTVIIRWAKLEGAVNPSDPRSKGRHKIRRYDPEQVRAAVVRWMAIPFGARVKQLRTPDRDVRASRPLTSSSVTRNVA